MTCRAAVELLRGRGFVFVPWIYDTGKSGITVFREHRDVLVVSRDESGTVTGDSRAEAPEDTVPPAVVAWLEQLLREPNAYAYSDALLMFYRALREADAQQKGPTP